MGEFLILMGLATGLTALIALIRPLPRVYLPTRKRAFYLFAASFLVFGMGGSMLPEPAGEQLAHESEHQDDDENGLPDVIDGDSSNTETRGTKDLEEEPEHVALHEIMAEWNSERNRYNDPAAFVFSTWKHKPIRTTGLVFEIDEDVRTGGGFHVYFHDGGGDKELVNGIWKWAGFNQGVYAKFEDNSDMDSVEVDEFLNMVCTGVQPHYDREGATLFGIELQHCEPTKESE